MMLQSMIFSAWLVFDSGFLGIQLSQYSSTNPAMLVFSFATLWCFIPPDSRSYLTLEGTGFSVGGCACTAPIWMKRDLLLLPY